MRQVGPGDLNPNRALDPGGKHVDTVADRWNPDVGQSRHFHHPVQFFHQLFRGHARAPFFARLELDSGLEHLQWRRVGGRLSTACLAKDVFDFRYRLDQAIGHLKQLAGLLCGQARQCRGHVEQVAFVQRWEELTTQPRDRPQGADKDHYSHRQGQFRIA
ncbi:hypothetical protein D9M70_475680 [compost metagenome]